MAVQVTVLVPTGKVCGDVTTVLPILQVTIGVGDPVVMTLNATEREHWPVALLVMMLSGHMIAGGTLAFSQTFMAMQVNDALLTAPTARIMSIPGLPLLR